MSEGRNSRPKNTSGERNRKGGASKPTSKSKPRPNNKIEGKAPGKRPVAKITPGTTPDSMRLNKYISNSGVCNRKEADLYISTGSVRVNGQVITEMGHKVKLTDEVRFDGQLLNPVKKVYILLNKPKGFTIEATTSNEKKSIYALTRTASKSPLKPVGKMERNTSGLLLLTNDDSLLGNLNGSGRIRQIFHVELDKNVSQIDFEKILNGVRIDEKTIKIDALSYVDDSSKREVGIQLNSQKNKVVTRIFDKLGYTINKMDRAVFSGLTKKDLPRGTWRELTEQELINLKMIS